MGTPFVDDGGVFWTLIGLAMFIWLAGGSFISSYKSKQDRNSKYYIGIFATRMPVNNGIFGFNLVPNLEGETLEEMGENALDRDLIGVIRGINSQQFMKPLESTLKPYYMEEPDECYVVEKELFIKIIKIYSREYSLTMF